MARISLIEEENAEASAKRIMESLKKQFGVVIDPVKALAHKPDFLRSILSLTTVADGPGSIEPGFKEVLNIRASVLNGCEFCTQMHSNIAGMHKVSKEKVEGAKEGSSSAAFDDRLLADRFDKFARARRPLPHINIAHVCSRVQRTDVQPTFVHAHGPYVTVAQVVKPRAKTACRYLYAPAGEAGAADDQIPAIVRMHANDLPGRRSDAVQPIEAAALNASADVQRVLKCAHGHGDLVEIPAVRPELHNLLPLIGWRTFGLCLPELKP